MKISNMIAQLEAIKAREGDLECTCTGSFLPDQNGAKNIIPDSFESTVESFQVTNSNNFGKHLRIDWRN